MVGGSLTIEADVLPVLGAFQAAQGWGTVAISFEAGVPKTIAIDEKLKFTEQVRNWVRRFTRSRPVS